MPGFEIEVPHSLGKAEATERLKSFSDKIRDRYKEQVSDLEESWSDDALTFSFKTFGFKVGGTITVEEESIKLDGNLPIAAMAFKGKIQSEFQGQIERLVS